MASRPTSPATTPCASCRCSPAAGDESTLPDSAAVLEAFGHQPVVDDACRPAGRHDPGRVDAPPAAAVEPDVAAGGRGRGGDRRVDGHHPLPRPARRPPSHRVEIVGHVTRCGRAESEADEQSGVVAPRGPAYVGRLAEAIENADSGLPDLVRELGALLLDQVADLDAKTAALEHELRQRAREDEQAVRLMSIPGIGPLTAMAILAFAPPMESFRRGRDFSAWLGLVPRQHSTGGKPKLGKVSKMGQRDLRRLLVVGAMATVGWAVRRGTRRTPGWPGCWLASRACWSRWRWPTARRASPGR